LPNWFLAPFDLACMPDMALDRSGAAFISSNAQPAIWRIDADSFELSEHQIVLQGKAQWDVGFGALAFAPDGTLHAADVHGGLAVENRRRHSNCRMIHLSDPPLKECAFAAQFLKDFERSQKPWTRP
jgi:hypothetical protein